MQASIKFLSYIVTFSKVFPVKGKKTDQDKNYVVSQEIRMYLSTSVFTPLLSPDIGKRVKMLEINGRTAKNRRRAGNSQDFVFFTVISYIFLFFVIFSNFFFFSDTLSRLDRVPG